MVLCQYTSDLLLELLAIALTNLNLIRDLQPQSQRESMQHDDDIQRLEDRLELTETALDNLRDDILAVDCPEAVELVIGLAEARTALETAYDRENEV